MTFYWPHILWLLAAVIVLAALDAVRRGRDEVERGWPKILRAWAGARQAAVGSEARHSSRSRLMLWLGIAFGVVALARPQWGRVEEPVFDQSHEIIIALDLSRSMLAPDVRPTRLERARLLIQGLLDGMRGERVGLVVFAGTAFLQVPMSADYEVLNDFLPALNPGFMPTQGTDYTAMLRSALDGFGAAAAADRYLVVLSDGESLTDGWRNLLDELRQKKITVIGLGVGTAAGAFIPAEGGSYVKDERGAVVLSKLNSSTLQELASATHGVYTDASTWIDLAALLKQMIAAGHRGEFKEKREIRHIERYQWALAPALLCLLMSLWWEFPVRPRVRDLPLAGPARRPAPRPAGANGAVAAIALLLALAAAALPTTSLNAAEDTSAYAAPLSKLVGRLSAQPGLSAADCSSMAQETATWGRRLQKSGQPVTPGPVNDALSAVDLGMTLGPKAADWPELRKQLESLLQKPPEQKQDQQQQQKQDKDQQNRDQQQDQQNPENSQDKQSQQQPKDQPSQKQEQQQQPKQPEKGNTGETQKIGGQPTQPKDAKADPSLVLPIQKLDQLRNQDSPAELFQMLDSREYKTPPKKGRDW